MRFQVFFRAQDDRRAPSTVILESAEYENVGGFEAPGLKQLVVKVRETPAEDSVLEQSRPFRIGDVAVDTLEQSWILTPSIVWAKVETL